MKTDQEIRIYYRIKSFFGREFRCYYNKQHIWWLPYYSPPTFAAYELPSNEMEERLDIAQKMGISLSEITFIWNQ